MNFKTHVLNLESIFYVAHLRLRFAFCHQKTSAPPRRTPGAAPVAPGTDSRSASYGTHGKNTRCCLPRSSFYYLRSTAGVSGREQEAGQLEQADVPQGQAVDQQAHRRRSPYTLIYSTQGPTAVPSGDPQKTEARARCPRSLRRLCGDCTGDCR